MNNSDNTEKKPATHRFQPLPTGKVFDVVRPGRAPASPSSRPVIVNQPPVADDQFVSKKQAEAEEEPTSVVSVKVETQAEVVREEPAAPAPEAPKAPTVVMLSQVDARMDEQLEALAAEEPTAHKEDQVKEEPPVEEAAPEQPSAPEKGKSIQVVSEEPEQPAEEPAQAEQAEPEQAPREEQGDQKLLRPLTDEDIATHLGHDELVANTNFTSADMVVSHHRHRLTVWQFLLVFGLIVVLAVIALNFLLDAGVVTTELSVPHTNILR